MKLANVERGRTWVNADKVESVFIYPMSPDEHEKFGYPDGWIIEFQLTEKKLRVPAENRQAAADKVTSFAIEAR